MQQVCELRRMEGEVELVIDDVAFGGKGVGRAEGKAVFVPFTIEGERVTVRVVREKNLSSEAELVRVTEARRFNASLRNAPISEDAGAAVTST